MPAKITSEQSKNLPRTGEKASKWKRLALLTCPTGMACEARRKGRLGTGDGCRASTKGEDQAAAKSVLPE